MKPDQNGPIILIGAARSGTKFARSILDASSDIAAIPYDVNYIWRYGNERVDHDELDPASVTPKIRAFITRQLYRLAGISGGDATTLVEKTVGNTLRIAFINAVFPDARYIHLIRDGRAVTESSMRMWQAPPDTGSLLKKLRSMPLSSIGYVMWFGFNFIKGLVSGRGGGETWGPRYRGIDQDVAAKRPLVEICALQWLHSVEKALEGLQHVKPEQVFTISYTDLVSNEERIRELVSFTGLSDETVVLENYRKTVRTENDEKWREKMSKEDIEKMMNIIAPLLEKQGFVEAMPAEQGSDRKQ